MFIIQQFSVFCFLLYREKFQSVREVTDRELTNKKEFVCHSASQPRSEAEYFFFFSVCIPIVMYSIDLVCICSNNDH
jgi:hypothetical protein